MKTPGIWFVCMDRSELSGISEGTGCRRACECRSGIRKMKCLKGTLCLQLWRLKAGHSFQGRTDKGWERSGRTEKGGCGNGDGDGGDVRKNCFQMRDELEEKTKPSVHSACLYVA